MEEKEKKVDPVNGGTLLARSYLVLNMKPCLKIMSIWDEMVTSPAKAIWRDHAPKQKWIQEAKLCCQ